MKRNVKRFGPDPEGYGITPPQVFCELLVFAVIVWLFSLLGGNDDAEAKTEQTSCIDGYVAQWDGEKWVPTLTKTTKLLIPCKPFGEVQKP